jgi:hypothetical protein
VPPGRRWYAAHHQDLLDARPDPRRQILRDRRHLVRHDATGRGVEQREVGEGATDVDA